ncbi:MAG: polyphosphate polymerase domain-containing protein [Alphaproteobacteria bacterium]|nr:polyphosphate polymerase domain-containing protein [Alphaproteobacteria bacterium]
MTTARYEFKYVVPPEVADAIRERTAVWMERDAFGDDGTYRVTSLYLDRWDRMLARQTWEGVRERFKLRLRYYDHATDIFWAEVKLRVGKSIAKLRDVVPLEEALSLASGMPLPPDLAAAGRFRMLSEKIDAQPALWVRYQREAWVSPWGDGARLTFDSELEVQPPTGVARPVHDEWRTVDLDAPVIVEMKFNGAFPRWMQHIAEGLELSRTSCSKYAQGVELVGERPWAIGA